jgi:SAM-dependent methyltransferase
VRRTGTELGASGRPELEPASFRDPGSTVFYLDGAVLRGLTGEAAEEWRAVTATRFFPRLLEQGRVCRTAPAAPGGRPLPGHWPLVLEHERIPFISYPYEWTFHMLRDAALLHLEILLEALGEDVTTKDGYAYNVQWHGAAPVFIDVTSFERLRPGEPWAGYRQFCQTFLYPLFLRAYRDVAFQPWLRGRVDGIEPGQMRNLLSRRDLLRSGVLKHVSLHSAMEARYSGQSTRNVRRDLQAAGFSKELGLATIRALRKLVGGLSWRPGGSQWADYRQTSTYSEQERAAKAAFVAEALAGRGLGLVWDLGCNDGAYARVASEHAGYVVAVDGDEVVVDALYRRLREEGNRRILPLVMDLADPSPGIGWLGRERAPFLDRARPDGVLCLALVHHLAITGNVPLPQVVGWLRSLDARLVVEFVDPDDPMARRLLANKPAGMHGDYRRDTFERLVGEHFDVERRVELPSGTRTLYAAVPRG